MRNPTRTWSIYNIWTSNEPMSQMIVKLYLPMDFQLKSLSQVGGIFLLQ